MILVTGATGLVGAHLIKALLQKGERVRALYHSSTPPSDVQKAEWVKCDILDIIALEEVLKDVKQVYHCAAIVSFNPKRKHLLYQTNIEGTANIVNACLDAGVEKLVYVSSVAALGKINDGELINEAIQWNNENDNSEYGKTKYLAEMEVWRGIAEGLNAVIVNPGIILGSGDWNKGSVELFKTIYKEFPWYSEGVNGFVDVEDVVNAMILLMESNIQAQRFILSVENLSYKTLFTEIAHCFNKKPPHKNISPLLAAIVWRVEKIKSLLTGKDPMITKETAHSALTKVYYDNSKLIKYLPQFKYTPLKESLQRICSELKNQYKLS